MKKGLKFGIFSIVILSTILLASSVYAAGDASGISQGFQTLVDVISNILKSAYQAIEPLLKIIIGSNIDNSGVDPLAFGSKMIMILIVMAICYAILSNTMSGLFGGKVWPIWLISIAIPVLGFRYVAPQTIASVAMPSSAVGIAIICGLPIIAYFYLVQGFTPGARKFMWILLSAAFLGLFVMRAESTGYEIIQSGLYMYVIAAAIALIMLIMDGTLRKIWFQHKINSASQGLSGRRIGVLQNALSKVHDSYSNLVNAGNPQTYTGTTPGNIGPTKVGYQAYQKDVEYYEKEIKKLI